ncbi:hypothetical protein HYV74_04360 [Candidatus Uhrbacteria bacterium]|nr:hypothetical protein [Candidatus Uhrbacteria bacterium]
MRLPFTWYRATPAEYVVKFVNGARRAEGKGKIFFVGPRTTLARVMATEFGIGYAFTERTADGQEVVVHGEVVVRFDVQKMLDRHDFSFDPRSGVGEGSEDVVESEVQAVLQTYVRREIATKKLKDALASAAALQATVAEMIKNDSAAFDALGVGVCNLFVTNVSPANLDLKKALEAEAREQMLAAADRALADRRMDAARNDRSLKEFESDTAMTLEQRRAALVEARNKNVVAEAEADAEANRKRLEPYAHVDPRMVFALGIRELGANGRIGQFNVTPEFLAAMQGASNGRMPGA